MKRISVIAILVVSLFFTSCIATHQSMREATTKINIQKSDFQISDQVAGSAKQIKVIGIDWSRIFKKETGYLFAQTIGCDVKLNAVERYALYELLRQNPGYDVVFYPTFSYKQVSVLGLYKKTEVTATARLGKLNK